MLISSPFLSFCLVTLAMAIPGIITVPVINDEVMGFAQVSESIARSPSDDPNSIDVQIDAFGETRNLRLVPHISNVFAPDFSGYIADQNDNGEVVIQKIDPTQTELDDFHSKLYTDSTGISSLYVERRQGQITLEGILDHDTRIEWRTNCQERTIYQPVVHVVYRRTEHPEGACLTIAPNITDPTSTDQPKIETRALPALIQPEVVVVMDYETSKFHNFNLDSAKKYLGIFFNSVNRLYATIDSPKIQNVITGLVLTKHESMQNFVAYISNPTVDARATIYEFGKWVNKQNSITSDFDIALWMTAFDIASIQKGNLNTGTLGIAKIAGACKGNQNLNVGLGEDIPGTFSGILTLAHEMAHLYGSTHDGDYKDFPKGNPGALNCPPEEGYIMSYQHGSKNKFFFSTCSINQMKYMMGSSSGACLLNTPKKSVVKLIPTLPGTIKSLEDQCSATYGPGYTFSEFRSRLSMVCVRLWCTETSTYYTRTIGPALEGSRCGTGMICIKGECRNQ